MRRKTRILIVEDNVIQAKDLEKNLIDLGYTVTSIVTNFHKALKQVEKDRPDLVLMDIVLHEKPKGIATSRRIRKRFNIPIVYLTAHFDKDILKKAKITEPYGFLIKPVDERSLHATIQIALSKHAIEMNYRKQAEEALRQSEEQYRRLVSNINEGIVIQDRRGIITFANERFLKMLGRREEEVVGRSVSSLLGEGMLIRDRYHMRSHVGNEDSRSFEIAWKRKDGERRYTLLSPKPIYDDRGLFQGTVSVLTDITERREVELQLRRSHEELRSLSQHLQRVREDESQRIAREIHDELGQKLTALKIDLGWLAHRLGNQHKIKKKILQKIESMSDLLDKTIQSVQKISTELRPGLLDDLGLVPAIEWLAEDFQKRTNIKCRTKLACEHDDLGKERTTAVFRIAQEGLTNVARHARATKVQIHLEEADGKLVLRIKDNGRGIREDEVHAPSSLGLMGMRERIRPLGGELTVEGKPKKGTTLTVVLPIKRGWIR